MLKTARYWLSANYKTVFFNFKYLPIRQALQLPIRINKRCLLLKTGGKVRIDTAIYPGMISIGEGKIGIFDLYRSRSVWEVKGEIVFKGKVKIGHGSKICVGDTGKLVIGNNFEISAESSLVCFKEIVIGDNCLLSWDILIIDTDFHKITGVSDGTVSNPDKKIIIGSNVWIGCRSTILKGSEISSNTVVAANTVVNKKFETGNCVIGGNPGKIVKTSINWKY